MGRRAVRLSELFGGDRDSAIPCLRGTIAWGEAGVTHSVSAAIRCHVLGKDVMSHCSCSMFSRPLQPQNQSARGGVIGAVAQPPLGLDSLILT
jgi:hypothetical protein